MKKRNLTLAILVMVVATLVSVAIVSCKKEDTVAPTGQHAAKAAFTPPQVDDMNAYLKDFKQRMQSAAKGDDEALSLDEAAWYLSSVANYDFGHANVECDGVRFDTLYAQVNITNGTVLLSDLHVAYEEISTKIDKFYHSLTLDNKHFRFINVVLSENGEAIISLITTYNNTDRFLSDTCWYFEDEWVAEDSCYKYFGSNQNYPASTTGKLKLQEALNLVESHQTISAPVSSLVYYTFSYDTTFYYRENIDPYGSPNYMNSRLFVNNTYLNMDISNRMCYLFDSALGLGYSNCPMGQCVVSWALTYKLEEPFPEHHERFWKEHYELTVGYGQRHEIISEPGHNEY